jgi:hypothetical protein
MNFTLTQPGPALLTGLEGVRQKAQWNENISRNRATVRGKVERATLRSGAKNVAGVCRICLDPPGRNELADDLVLLEFGFA